MFLFQGLGRKPTEPRGWGIDAEDQPEDGRPAVRAQPGAAEDRRDAHDAPRGRQARRSGGGAELPRKEKTVGQPGGDGGISGGCHMNGGNMKWSSTTTSLFDLFWWEQQGISWFWPANDGQDYKGITALGYAIGANRIAVVKLLLDSRANPYAVDSSGNSGLHYAAGYGRKELLEYLLKVGANVNQPNAQGLTPLGAATQNRQEATMAVLKAHGAQ